MGSIPIVGSKIMKPVDQLIVSVQFGDCTRACIASVLELDINVVPNFITFGSGWFRYFWDYLKELGFGFHGTGFPIGEEYPRGHILSESPNVDGFVIASVPSKTFENIGHSVVMNLKGLIVHDPNPNKAWQDINDLESGDLQHWSMISKTEGN